ncbi:carbohydrate kinase family protein [Candidatus Berkelbacteria bacterium]|nr:carbohydrate kinase family protein [Candidatus Berkelbacteria bacterium]
MTYDLFTIGDTHLDTLMVLDPADASVRRDDRADPGVICLRWADKIPVRESHHFVAGNAANVAVAGARLGLAAGLYSLLGDDDIADFELGVLRAEGVETTYTTKTPGAPGHQSTVISLNGERTILVYHAPRVYRLPAVIPRTSWVYLTSLGPGFERLLPDLKQYVADTGAALAYQPGTYQLRLAAAQSQSILEATTLIIMNTQEARAYTGQARGEIPDLLGQLHQLGPRLAVITDGIRGSYASNGQTIWRMGVRPEVRSVESTGAGDAFSAAFVTALAHGAPIPEALRWGTFNAESVIQQLGPQAGLLRRSELEQLLVDHPDFIAREL